MIFCFISPCVSFAETVGNFGEINIEAPFKDVLLNDPDFMDRGGVQVFNYENHGWILVGISKLAPSEEQITDITKITRIGEIKARAGILEFIDGVKVSTFRENQFIKKSDTINNNQMNLKSFFQTTKSEAKGKIQQLPVIGTWRAKDRDIFYVAVGTTKTKTTIVDGENEICLSTSNP